MFIVIKNQVPVCYHKSIPVSFFINLGANHSPLLNVSQNHYLLLQTKN